MMDEAVVYTRDTLRDLIMTEEDIPRTMKALGLFYVNTISDEDVKMINDIAPIILEKLQTGEMEDVINILAEANVPKPLLAILQLQMGLYATKISNNQAE